MSCPSRRPAPLRSCAATVAAGIWLGLALAAPAGPAAASERLAGNVLSVDAEANTVTLIDAGRRHTVSIAPDTPIRHAGADRALSDIKRGDRIVVTLKPEVEGDAAAASVAIAGPGRLVPGGAAAVPGFASGLNARNLPPR